MVKRATPSDNDSAAVFKDILAASKAPELLLVTANDGVRPRRIEERLIEKFGSAFSSVKRIRADELHLDSIAKLEDDRSTLSLFSGAKLYLIFNIDSVSQAVQKPLVDFLSKPVIDTAVWCFSTPLPASNIIAKAVKTHGIAMVLEELSGASLQAWTQRECKNQGISEISPSVLSHCVELGENNPDRIAQLVSQLALYLDQDPATEKALTELFPAAFVAGEFELVDSIITGTPVQSELLFETLLQNGKSPFMLIGMIAKIFSNYHAIRAMLDRGVPPDAIREQLKMTPWVFNKSLTAAKRLRPRDILLHLEAIVRCDSKLKNRSLGAEAIFSELFSTLRPATRSSHA